MPHFGHVSYYQPGDTFRNRLELAASEVHRPRRAGVCGTQQGGAESIVLADQYEDDAYTEDEIIYAGHGGRDVQTGRQTTDQTATPRNLALLKSITTGQPVRVLRKVPAEHGRGEDVYRYEGLYRIISYEYGPGKSGFRVYTFRLQPHPLAPSPAGEGELDSSSSL